MPGPDEPGLPGIIAQLAIEKPILGALQDWPKATAACRSQRLAVRDGADQVTAAQIPTIGAAGEYIDFQPNGAQGRARIIVRRYRRREKNDTVNRVGWQFGSGRQGHRAAGAVGHEVDRSLQG